MFTIGLPFRGRPLPRRPWKLVQTSLKVKKSGGRPFRAESSSFGAYSARKLFPFHVCTMDADGSGNKRPTEKSEQKRNSIQSVDCYRSICCPEILQEGYFWKLNEAGRRQTALPPEKSICFFLPLANIRLCPVRCALSLCRHSVRLSAFLQRCSAKAVALGVLSLESIVMIFSLLFISSSLLSISPYFLSFSYSFSPLL